MTEIFGPKAKEEDDSKPATKPAAKPAAKPTTKPAPATKKKQMACTNNLHKKQPKTNKQEIIIL